jgi:hypothetical protein
MIKQSEYLKAKEIVDAYEKQQYEENKPPRLRRTAQDSCERKRYTKGRI